MDKVDLKVKLRDGSCAFIKNFTPEDIAIIKKCVPEKGEFILEAHKEKEFFDVDVIDVLDIEIEE